MESIQINAPELEAIEESKAAQIKATFEPMAEMLQDIEDAFNGIVKEASNEINEDVISRARRLDLDIGKIATKVEANRKDQKEEYLRAGKAIDGVSNIFKWAISDKRNKLKEIQNFFKLQEEERIEALQADRVAAISPYIEDAEQRKFSDMADDVWEAYLAAKTKDFNDRIEAETQAELDRIEAEKQAREEAEAMRSENERLKEECRIAEEAQAKADKIRKAQEAQAAAALKSERDKAAAEKKKLDDELAAARKKIEDEARAKAQREKDAADELARIEAEEKAAIEAELSKGDAAKVTDLIADLEALKIKYSFKSSKNQKMYTSVCLLLDKVVVHIQK